MGFGRRRRGDGEVVLYFLWKRKRMNVWFSIFVEEQDEDVVFGFGGRGRRQVDVVMW